MKIVVTGHRGFIGQYLTERLRTGGHAIIGLSQSEGFDVTHFAHFNSLDRFDVLIHLAGLSYVPLSFKNPVAFYHTNISGTLNCLEVCRIHQARMIFLSTYIYGQPKFLPVSEDHPIQPTTPYAQSKFLAEQLCEAYSRDFGVPVCVIRPFNVYGGHQPDNFLIPTIINQIPSGRIHLQDPRPKRDFVHVLDLVEAIDKLIFFQGKYRVYNIGTGVSVSIHEIISILKSRSLIKENQVFFSEERRVNEILDVRADISRARKEIGWVPAKNFSEELIHLALERINSN